MLPALVSRQLDKILPFISLDQKCYFICLLAAYLFSFFYFTVFVKQARNSPKWDVPKHAFIIAIGHLFICTCFRLSAFVHIYLPVLFTYFVVRHLHRFLKWPAMPLVVFVFVLLHLSLHQIIRQVYFYNEYVLDHTAPMMIMAIKLTTFAFDIYDQNDHLEADIPGFLEFLGYCFLFPGLLAGPCISFKDYRRFINGSYFSNLDISKPIRGRKVHATKCFIASIVFMLLYILTRQSFSCAHVLSAEFLARPYWYQWVYMHIAHIGWRSKYYFAWLNAEGAYAVIGLGFQKASPTSQPTWNRIQNVRPLKVEFSADPRQIVTDWNITTNCWLRGCVYRRLGIHQHGLEGKPGFRVSLATYAVSAFWHGFYPGYYFTFFSMALMSFFSRLVYRSFTWPLNPSIRPLVMYVPVFTLINYMTFPFTLQTFADSYQFCKNYYFFGHIFTILGILLLKYLPAMHQAPKKQQEQILAHKIQ